MGLQGASFTQPPRPSLTSAEIILSSFSRQQIRSPCVSSSGVVDNTLGHDVDPLDVLHLAQVGEDRHPGDNTKSAAVLSCRSRTASATGCGYTRPSSRVVGNPKHREAPWLPGRAREAWCSHSPWRTWSWNSGTKLSWYHRHKKRRPYVLGLIWLTPQKQKKLIRLRAWL